MEKNKKEIIKPFSLKVQEFSEGLVNLINSSDLNCYVLKNELQKVYQQLEAIENEEINKYNDEYKESEK